MLQHSLSNLSRCWWWLMVRQVLLAVEHVIRQSQSCSMHPMEWMFQSNSCLMTGSTPRGNSYRWPEKSRSRLVAWNMSDLSIILKREKYFSKWTHSQNADTSLKDTLNTSHNIFEQASTFGDCLFAWLACRKSSKIRRNIRKRILPNAKASYLLSNICYHTIKNGFGWCLAFQRQTFAFLVLIVLCLLRFIR